MSATCLKVCLKFMVLIISYVPWHKPVVSYDNLNTANTRVAHDNM